MFLYRKDESEFS